LSRIARDQRGVSAVEFALLAPMMVALYFGCVEISNGVAADRKVSLIAAALANLTGQVTTISVAGMTNILDASKAIVTPYDSTKLHMTVSCINIDADKVARVKWSVTRGGTVASGTVTVPPALLVASSQLILADASYDYTPAVAFFIKEPFLTLQDKMYMSPRISAPSYNAIDCT
jgi:Flp pilus assembly protein TadG